MKLETRILSAIISSCNCQTKTNEPQFHSETCRYRLLTEFKELVQDMINGESDRHMKKETKQYLVIRKSTSAKYITNTPIQDYKNGNLSEEDTIYELGRQVKLKTTIEVVDHNKITYRNNRSEVVNLPEVE